MRFVGLALAVATLSCASESQMTVSYEPRHQRTLVTDDLPFLLERDRVRVFLGGHDWCQRRTWPHSDEFVICDKHPYLNRSTPPMVTVIGYDAADRATAYAVFTPVPCRMYGRCDSLRDTNNLLERELIDHGQGLRAGLAVIGASAQHRDDDLGSMQQRTVDALSGELVHRFGSPAWRDAHQYGTTWTTTSSDIGLFVVGDGDWVVETHELHRTGPPGLAP